MLRLQSSCVCVGENVLHMAIVNEDPAMVKFLLDRDGDGVVVHQRCCGNFFTPNDQQSSRRDNDQHEWFDVPTNTNYEGLTTLYCLIHTNDV